VSSRWPLDWGRIEDQLLRAGVRLAKVINEALQ
jgi:hypothetical protein